ncbi:hypothetical protein GQ457_02G018820 [Hibiscus cannabinus]
MVESEYLKVIQTLRRTSSKSSSITLIRDIRRLCDQDWQVFFHHVNRSGNRVTDSLAKLASSSSFDVLHFTTPLLYVACLLQEDCLPPSA